MHNSRQIQLHEIPVSHTKSTSPCIVLSLQILATWILAFLCVSICRSNNGHMIKFELFDTENSYQCHFAQIGTFVVSIAHYMRAYFNHQALVNGQDFSLPNDAGYLNVSCICCCCDPKVRIILLHLTWPSSVIV